MPVSLRVWWAELRWVYSAHACRVCTNETFHLLLGRLNSVECPGFPKVKHPPSVRTYFCGGGFLNLFVRLFLFFQFWN